MILKDYGEKAIQLRTKICKGILAQGNKKIRTKCVE